MWENVMANAGPRRAAVGCFLVLALWIEPASAEEGDQLRATVDQPARITATGAAFGGNAAATSRRVVLSVTHYHPTDDGSPVEVVVKAVIGGVEQDIGRFGVTPDREFTSTAPSTTQRFSFSLPRELAAVLAAGKPVIFSVHLVPIRGEGKGAAVQVGVVEIH
jgi:hypothetical protein